MAVSAQLSMKQATALSLQQELKEREHQVRASLLSPTVPHISPAERDQTPQIIFPSFVPYLFSNPLIWNIVTVKKF